jgi:hypothetical protein
MTRYTAYTSKQGSAIFFRSCICTVHEWSNRGSEHPFHHDICHLEPFVRRLRLGLLRVCSQIYMEAALIPFIHNTFCFAHGPLLPQFISSLVPAQATAITSLSLSNIFVGDLLDRDYWYGFPELRHLAVTVCGHDGCMDGDGDLKDYRRFNALYVSSVRKLSQDFPSHEPLEHFNLESFSLRTVCASGLKMRRCPTREEWQQWAEAVGQRVSARPFKRRPERRTIPGRQLLQIYPVNRAIPVQSSFGGYFWRSKGLCVQYLSSWKTSLFKRFQRWTRSES